MTARLTFEDTMAAILDALEQMVERPLSGSGVSSIEVEDMSKGDPKITTKTYVGSPLTRADADAHLDVHAYAKREAARRSMDQWAETVDELQRQDALREASGDPPLAVAADEVRLFIDPARV